MKYRLTLLILSVFTLISNASDATPKVDNEFAYIQPITVEEAPVAKAVESSPQNTNASEKVDSVKLDADKDGVPDLDDICSTTPKGAKVDYRGCELDSDSDGVVDSKDQCTDTSNDFLVDDYGCPQIARLKANYEPYKYNISNELTDDLRTFSSFLKENKGYQVIIYGYADTSGEETVNKILSQKRANAIKEALISYGTKSIRITSIGKGTADPIADNIDEEGRAQNRRIEVELLQ